MEDRSRPYIIYLTDPQEQELRQNIKQNTWNITVFKRIHDDLQFLVDLMIQGEELDTAFLKDNVSHYARRHCRIKKFENGVRMTRKKCYSIVSNSEQDMENTEEVLANDGEKLVEERKSNKEQQKENTREDTLQVNLQTENEQEELQEENAEDALLEEDMQEQLNEVKSKETKVKGRTKVSARTVPRRQRKYRHKKLANTADRMSHFSCEICGKVAASERYLQRHIEKLHSEEAQKKKVEEKRKKQVQEINVCHICRKQFAHKYALIAHHLNVHGEKKDVFQCDLCGAIVKHKGSLVQHKKSVHSDQRPHKCDICDSEFKLYQQLKTHQRRHDPDFVETCTVCGKTLKKGHLVTHMKRHTNDRKFKCDKCGKTFYEKQDLKRHIILHSGEKPNKCPHCSYACAFKGNLTKHIKVRHETALYIPELQQDKRYARPKQSSERKLRIVESYPSKGNTPEHHYNVGTRFYDSAQTQLGKEVTDQFSSMQYLSRGITENSLTSGGNKPRIEELHYQNDFNEGLKRHSLPSVPVFSDTDSQSESFTPDSQLHVLRPVQHVGEQLVHNLSGLDQDVSSSNFIDFRETYLLKMPSNEAE